MNLHVAIMEPVQMKVFAIAMLDSSEITVSFRRYVTMNQVGLLGLIRVGFSQAKLDKFWMESNQLKSWSF